MQFEFATSGRIIFGRGSIRLSASYVENQGFKNLLVLTGKDSKRVQPFIESLTNSKLIVIQFQINSEPTVELVETAAVIPKENRVDAVIGIGGGSVIDAGKAISALATNPGNLLDYLEVVGSGKPLLSPPLPFIAIPTTAGTGSEATRNAVITCKKEKVKASLRHHSLLPRLAVIDPELTLTVPPGLTAETGLDALTQLIEAFISSKSNPLTDALSIEGLKRAGRSLRRAYTNGDDISAREDMALASLFSGMALANAGLGAVHGFAAPIGGIYDAPHGAVCASLIAPVLITNLKALKMREKESPTIGKIRTIAQILTGRPQAQPEEAVEWLNETCSFFKIRRLREFGIKKEDFSLIAGKAQKASSMKGNPIQLTEEELLSILEMAY